MNLFAMAWRNLMNRAVQSWITMIIVAVGIAMALCVLILASGVKQGIKTATEPYGMIVGSKGSANQLVFNTIFLMDRPLGNIPLHVYEELKEDPRVNEAVPFALGDNYKGYRLVGTSEQFFKLKAAPKDPDFFQIGEGRVFQASFEAVIGSEVAQRTGLKVGDSFVSGHGVVAAVGTGNSHAEHPYTVVGIMKELQAPADQGIYVDMNSYWVSHGQAPHEEGEHAEEHEGEAHHDEHGDAHAGEKADEHPEGAAGQPNASSEGHAAGEHAEEPGVTAVLVKPKTYMDLMKMYQEINASTEAQAVFPGQVVAKVFDMMGTGEEMLKGVSYIVLGMAMLTIILSLYSSTLERRRTVAVLRAIGAHKSTVFSMVMVESFLLVCAGSVLGLGLGYGAAAALAAQIGTESSIHTPIVFDAAHLGVAGAFSLIGAAAGIIPAVTAFRTETAKYLNG
ncbi:ABC transporter permease [Paenibacillus turpanensis]|uniref:ABC transporter permease n=1 Tax=Paenibacillus turpanensis TaxID=2689078 RepID=UPI001407BDFC|nr:ABC transporter permease [Paenibacillus turpanensis]